jgi:hypothetical protein
MGSDVLHRPWSVEALTGKYYGTTIIDANGHTIMQMRIAGEGAGARPSPRQIEWWGGEELEPSDWHYETYASLEYAEAVVAAVNRSERTP